MKEINLLVKASKKYSICSCGLSKSLPFCDNEHRLFNEKNKTKYKSVKIFPSEDTNLKLKVSNWEDPPK